MLKEWIVKAGLSTALAGLAVYFHQLLLPLAMLLLVMICDYVTGLLAAYTAGDLSSRTGILGIMKKCCYFFAVVVGGGIDWLLQTALAQIGVSVEQSFTIAVLVLVWLVINELLSILENLAEIGVPLPGFLHTLIQHLKSKVEAQGENF